MIYMDDRDVKSISPNWRDLIEVIRSVVGILEAKDYAQPLKPYLRYRDLSNRIISMPAFVGGIMNTAGLKWISSFPSNVAIGLPRAHSILILNDASTGKPEAIINTSRLSAIRTASVSGYLIDEYCKARSLKDIKIGIIGWGPIGQYHLLMCEELLNKKIREVTVYDVRQIQTTTTKEFKSNVTIAGSWQNVYKDADLLITCTSSTTPYIDLPPKKGSLHLNVSLRDYHVTAFDDFKNSIIVDDWDEVCRESTDIERMSIEKGLSSNHVKTIIDVHKGCMAAYPCELPVMFNPMGMAVFDMGIAAHYRKIAVDRQIGTTL